MEIVSCKDEQEIARKAFTWCQNQIEGLSARSIYVPAGQTPVHLYRLWEQERPAYLEGVQLVQIDDVLTGEQKGMFKAFLEEHLPSYRRQIRWIGDEPFQADLAILGLGLNGHVAFHEPGLPEGFNFGCVRLQEITRKRLNMSGQEWGITYGAGCFLKTRAILMMVSGAGKKAIFDEWRTPRSNGDFPALSLKKHPHLDVLASSDLLKN